MPLPAARADKGLTRRATGVGIPARQGAVVKLRYRPRSVSKSTRIDVAVPALWPRHGLGTNALSQIHRHAAWCGSACSHLGVEQ